MSLQDDAVSVLLELPSGNLINLGHALHDGTLRYGFSRQGLLPFAGDQSTRIDAALRDLIAAGFNWANAGILCLSMGRALAERDTAESCVQLILSGPDVAGTPVVDTKTTVVSLFEEASEEVIISSYVFHEAAEFFQRLAEKHDADPNFKVLFLVDLSHRRSTKKEPLSLLAQSFGIDFRKKHWPGKRAPELWHDPRSFDANTSGGGVLHAKTVVVDRKVAFITSANFTGAAQTRNIEAGILLRQPRTAARLHAYFSGLIATGALQSIPLRAVMN